jgi:hypothetical protein
VVGADTVEAVRNNQKVAELRPGGASASASSGASATAIAAAGSLIAIGFGVGWQTKQSAHAGVFAHAPAPFYPHQITRKKNLTPFFYIFFFYTGSEGSAVQLGWKVVPGSCNFGSQQGSRERPRVFT